MKLYKTQDKVFSEEELRNKIENYLWDKDIDYGYNEDIWELIEKYSYPHKVEETTLIDVADEQGFDYVETCNNRRGYPSGIRKAIVGFEDFDEALEFADLIGGEVVSLDKKDGHHFWYNEGGVSGEYEMKPEYFGNNCIGIGEDADHIFETEVLEVLKDKYFESIEELKDWVDEWEDVINEVRNEPDIDDKVCFLMDGTPTSLEIMYSKCMNYYHDTHTYKIGVVKY